MNEKMVDRETRSRKVIEKEGEQSFYGDRLILEVLLDIRDLLEKIKVRQWR